MLCSVPLRLEVQKRRLNVQCSVAQVQSVTRAHTNLVFVQPRLNPAPQHPIQPHNTRFLYRTDTSTAKAAKDQVDISSEQGIIQETSRKQAGCLPVLTMGACDCLLILLHIYRSL